MVHRQLPRLAREFYQGYAIVHWTLGVEERATGWLNDDFFQNWKLILLHACSRYAQMCPVYALMPDHIHVLLAGSSPVADQTLAISFVRKHLRGHLAPADWQRTPYDHILRNNERDRSAFQTIAAYILNNPTRAGLVQKWNHYP